ncbi:MAG: hypothetical protein C0626_13065 [Arcobacter sp.]|uniref:hypothetical protein n=1 Tax=uncultured Arcobacter sp. TaxID=165434 RepID=UPI000CCA3A3C|nr:hypothetical protein [uncultured Arcobacter sp.]PLY08769.1 MAG: hypothetical protein C0626_13065 [Arcobacter sp.]
MIDKNQQNNDNIANMSSSAKLFFSNYEQFKTKAVPSEIKLFNSYFPMMDALPHLKKKNVLDKCPIYDLFGKSTKIIYEQYDCVDIDSIKINSNKILINFIVSSSIPESFIEDMTQNIKNNTYANSEFTVKVTNVDTYDYGKIDIIYSIDERNTIFDEAELIDIYHGLSVLNLNPELQDKVKNMLIKAF